MVRALRQRGAERAYLALREGFVTPDTRWLDELAEKQRQLDLLSRAWSGPHRTIDTPRDARLFLVTGELETTFSFAPEIVRSFDAEVFNYIDHLPREPKERSSVAWRERLQRDLLKQFHAQHARAPFDLAILYVTHFECARSTLEAIRAAGVPAAVLCWDDKHSFREQQLGWPNGQEPLIGAATLHLTSSRECLLWYTSRGASAYYFPEAADPEIYRQIELEKDIDVSFVGGWYGARRDLIQALRSAGVAVSCWGPGTEGGPVSREEMIQIYNRSRINLGFGGVGDAAAITCLKGRDFEVPMTGNVYLTLYNHELTDHFAVGREILCYLNAFDAVEQIRYWRAQRGSRAAIGRAARERGIRDHTWTKRVTDLIRWMGILTERVA